MSRPPRPRPDTLAAHGGAAARRAVIRWSWRLYRREWRRQALIVALLTVTVAAAIASLSAAYNTAAAASDAEFGEADWRLRIDDAEPEALLSYADAAEEWFETVDVIGHRSVAIPGAVEALEYRAQDPVGDLGRPTLALVGGRFPTGTDEVAVTDGVAGAFSLEVGGVLDLDGIDRTVVGVVENPKDLNAEFVLVAALEHLTPESLSVLVDGTRDDVEAFLALDTVAASGTDVGERLGNEDVLTALGVLGVFSVALLLISLVAAAGFIVLAQRRQRELGMLAAIGATERHLRLVTLANGAIVGVIAAVGGTLIGLSGWILVVPRLEAAVAHRIDPLNLPWWLIVLGMLLAVGMATGAAWWPARTVAGVPITRALSGRPPRPRPAHRSAMLAGSLVVVGLSCLVLAERTSNILIIGGTLATIVGVLLGGPLVIRVVAAAAGRLPIGARLAMRDLARHQARSGAALAAISLVLGIPVAIVVTSSAASAADRGNLSDTQLVIWTRNPEDPEGVSPFYTVDPDDEGFSPFVPAWTEQQLGALEQQAESIATLLDEAAVTPLEVVIDPNSPPVPSTYGTLAVSLARPDGDGYRDVALLYAATPELMAELFVEPVTGDGPAVLTALDDQVLAYPGLYDPATDGFGTERVGELRRIPAGHTSLPNSFMTLEEIQRRGWTRTTIGWLVESRVSLPDTQIAEARELAAEAGMLVESRDHDEGLLALRWQATVAGTVLALGVLAMTVGLVRSAGAGELRTLTASGATSTIRRTLTAATAAGLALIGAVLGATAAYLALIAGYADEIGMLGTVPVVHLLALVGGVPVVAALAGWLLAGREPADLVRPAVD